MGAANIVLLAIGVARTYRDKATSLNFMRTDLVLVDHFFHSHLLQPKAYLLPGDVETEIKSTSQALFRQHAQGCFVLTPGAERPLSRNEQ